MKNPQLILAITVGFIFGYFFGRSSQTMNSTYSLYLDMRGAQVTPGGSDYGYFDYNNPLLPNDDPSEKSSETKEKESSPEIDLRESI